MNSFKDSYHYLSDEQRGYIYSLHEQGFSYYSIKNEFFSEYRKKIYDSTISAIIDKFKVTGSVADRPKSDRPLIYNEREDRALVRASLQDPLKSTRDIVDDREINPKRACRGTISTILRTHKLTSRLLSRRMSDLTSDYVKERLMFAKEHLHWGRCLNHRDLKYRESKISLIQIIANPKYRDSKLSRIANQKDLD